MISKIGPPSTDYSFLNRDGIAHEHGGPMFIKNSTITEASDGAIDAKEPFAARNSTFSDTAKVLRVRKDSYIEDCKVIAPGNGFDAWHFVSFPDPNFFGRPKLYVLNSEFRDGNTVFDKNNPNIPDIRIHFEMLSNLPVGPDPDDPQIIFLDSLEDPRIRDVGHLAFDPFIRQDINILGDYNGNGGVDAADYVLWRNGGPLQNEAASIGIMGQQILDQADYDFWRCRFGETSETGSAPTSIPEPSTSMLLIGMLLLVATYRRPNRFK
jgi:hypothetical protein